MKEFMKEKRQIKVGKSNTNDVFTYLVLNNYENSTFF